SSARPVDYDHQGQACRLSGRRLSCSPESGTSPLEVMTAVWACQTAPAPPAGSSSSRQSPRLLSRQPPPPSSQRSLINSRGGGQSNGALVMLSARQSPASQSRL